MLLLSTLLQFVLEAMNDGSKRQKASVRLAEVFRFKLPVEKPAEKPALCLMKSFVTFH